MQFSNTSYGCHDRAPFRDSIKDTAITVDDGGDLYFYVRVTPFRGTKNCQYTLSNLGQIDPGCNGCKHKVSVAPVEGPKEFIVFRVDGDQDDDAEQVSIPCTREVADRFIKFQRINRPDETFFLAKILKD